MDENDLDRDYEQRLGEAVVRVLELMAASGGRSSEHDVRDSIEESAADYHLQLLCWGASELEAGHLSAVFQLECFLSAYASRN